MILIMIIHVMCLYYVFCIGYYFVVLLRTGRFAIAHGFSLVFVGREAPHDVQFYWMFFLALRCRCGFLLIVKQVLVLFDATFAVRQHLHVCVAPRQTLLFAMFSCAAVLFGGLHFRKRICQISGSHGFCGTCFGHGRDRLDACDRFSCSTSLCSTLYEEAKTCNMNDVLNPHPHPPPQRYSRS